MRVLQIEFNELSPALIERFMAEGRLPNFRRVYESSQIFTTDAHAGPPNLEPWIQWPSVHYGVSHLTHGLRHLGPAPTGPLPFTPVARAASDAGLRVGVFGAMNVAYDGLAGFYLPDPWNTDVSPQPASLRPYFRTVGAMVRDSSRTEGSTPDSGLLPFGMFMLRHGLTAATVRVLGRQLLDERRDPGVRWRRASALDWIQYDVFRHYAAKERVDFATFFSNSTAHYQHYFWRHMQPDAFDQPPDPSDHPSYREAVRYGYESMDRILGRVLADHPAAILVLCTALSQQPWADATKQTYRPRTWDAVLRSAGLPAESAEVNSIMAEEFVLRFPTEDDAVRAQDAFSRLTVDSAPLMRFVREGSALVGGCAVTEPGATGRRVSGTADSGEPLLGELFVPIHAVRSGRHSPVGALWFRTGEHAVHETPVDLEDVAPTVLDLLGVAAPAEMTGSVLPLSGSLVRAERP